MKALTTIVLFIACLACVFAIPASYNQELAVNTTAQSYTFLTTPINTYGFELLVSSSSAGANSRAVVSNFVNLPIIAPSGAVTANNGLPAGYINLGLASAGIGYGLSINFTSDIDGNVDARITIVPSLIASINASLFGDFRPLYFNASANAYYELPANQYNISATGGISIFTRTSINFVLAVRNPFPLAISITNNAVVYANLVANTAASFAIAEATGTALYIYNLTTASAGTVSIRISANSQSQSAAVSSNNVLLSGIYSFNHSSGSNVNAQLSFTASPQYSASVVANADWYVFSNGAWVRQDSSVSGNVVTYNTDHFSDWSVQSSPNGGAASSLETPLFSKLLF